MIDYHKLIAANAQRWETAVFKPTFVAAADRVARRLVDQKAKAVYQAIQRDTNVPWWVIAVIHEREASQRWTRSIAQGDPWNARSIHVPAGRGPFKSFHDAAVDALTKCAPYAARWKDWSAGGSLTLLELYNGLGYEGKGIAAPYIWAGTNQYRKGKYIRDHVFDPEAVDTQLGCAVLLKEMMKFDSDIRFTGGAAVGLLDETRHDEVDPNEFPGAEHEDAPDPIPPEPQDDADVDAKRIEPEDGPPTAPPKPMATSKIGNTQLIAGAGAGAAGLGQLGKALGDPDEVADQITTIVDKSGHALEVTKQVVAVPKPGVLNAVVHSVTSPAFLGTVLLLVCIACAATWFWRRQHRQAGV